MEEAHELLHQFHTRVQAEKLLGQNLRTRNSKQYSFMEQIPYHLHVDLTVLKCVYLVSAMLIEVPDMVADQTLSPKFEDFITTELVPYSAVEHIIAASRALSNGLWLDCCSYIINSRMNVMVKF
jgi:translation initiation factor 3 subunit C